MAPKPPDTITLEIDREVRAFGEDEDRIAILSGYDTKSDANITLKGNVPPGAITPGLVYRFSGKFVEHEKYGRQFHFRSFSLVRPFGRRGLTKYLQQAPHIGPATANNLYTLFGDNVFEAFRERPAEVAAKMPRLTSQQIGEIAKWMTEREAIEAATIELMDLLASIHPPRKLIAQLIQKWGNGATDRIRQNPLCLRQFHGVGFLKADRLYCELGLPLDSLERQALCMEHIINKRSSETWVPLEEAVGAMRMTIASAAVRPADAVRYGVTNDLLETKSVDGREWIALKSRADDERIVAERILALVDKIPEWPDLSDETDLTEHQRQAACNAMQAAVGCLVGTPGTGKTYSLARIARRIMEQHSAGSLAICCPTGKAAVRVTEVMRQAGLHCGASTIHSLLGVASRDDDAFAFAHDESNPLPVKFIIIDEGSMNDIGITASLLRALPDDAHVLIVGDENQLPPVGHGAPLRDFKAAGIPFGELTEIRRNSGRIVEACKAMRETGQLIVSDKLDIPAGENLIFREQASPELTAMELEAVLAMIERTKKYSLKWGVQVLCAVNKNGVLSRKSLNERLQNLLNPDGERIAGNPFRVGDKVICLKNGRFPNHEPDAEGGESDKVIVANGELGEVLHIEPRRSIVKLQSPERVIVVPHGKIEKDDDEAGEQDGVAGQWDLGYAISCHKSQGSEFPLVLVIADDSPAAARVCDRSWVYTAISRAKIACVIIGRRVTVEEWCRRASITRRKTMLPEYLNGTLNETVEPAEQAAEFAYDF